MQVEGKTIIRKAKDQDLNYLWELISDNHEWKRYDGPYFERKEMSFSLFRSTKFACLLQGINSQIIESDGNAVGTVSCYWECEATRWLEAGLTIYSENCWGKGIGSKALRLWTTHLFNHYEIERVGITTWSGNHGMIKCAEKAGMKLEGRMRKCRYYQGVYYDSMRYGIIRDEWSAQR